MPYRVTPRPEEYERESIGQEFLRSLAQLLPQAGAMALGTVLGPQGAVGEAMTGSGYEGRQEAATQEALAQAEYRRGLLPSQERVAESKASGLRDAAVAKAVGTERAARTRAEGAVGAATMRAGGGIRGSELDLQGTKYEWDARERIAKLPKQWRKGAGRVVSDPAKMPLVTADGEVITVQAQAEAARNYQTRLRELNSVTDKTVNVDALQREAEAKMERYLNATPVPTMDGALKLAAERKGGPPAPKPGKSPTATEAVSSATTPYGASELEQKAAAAEQKAIDAAANRQSREEIARLNREAQTARAEADRAARLQSSELAATGRVAAAKVFRRKDAAANEARIRALGAGTGEPAPTPAEPPPPPPPTQAGPSDDMIRKMLGSTDPAVRAKAERMAAARGLR